MMIELRTHEGVFRCSTRSWWAGRWGLPSFRSQWSQLIPLFILGFFSRYLTSLLGTHITFTFMIQPLLCPVLVDVLFMLWHFGEFGSESIMVFDV